MIAMAAEHTHVEFSSLRPTASPRRSSGVRRALGTDGHDLPVLAAEHSPRVRLDWERMMEEGAQPALILGAERRLHGPR